MRGHFRLIATLAAAALAVAGCASTGGGSAQHITLIDKTAADLAVRKVGGGAYRIQLSGNGAPSRAAVENRLAYEASALTLQQQGRWFEDAAGSKGAGPAVASTGKRYSFRMENWRPAWRLRGADGWAAWAPTGSQDTAQSATTQYQASIDVIVHKERFDGENPLGFDAYALSDYIRPQVLAAAQ
jgi:hypothetical protein